MMKKDITYSIHDAFKALEFVEDNKILSHTSGYDGFYMALLERKK